MSPAATIVASPPGGGGATTTDEVVGDAVVVVGSTARARGRAGALPALHDESSARRRATTVHVTPRVLYGRRFPRRALTSPLAKPATLPRGSSGSSGPGAPERRRPLPHLRIGRQKSWPAPEARSAPSSAQT